MHINQNYKLNVSIVLYRNPKGQIEKVIKSLRDTQFPYKLELIDNSCDPQHFEWLKFLPLLHHEEYLNTNENLGFGKAHNISIKHSIDQKIPYHLVLNPDVFFEQKDILEIIFSYLESHPEVGLLSPKVLYPDGSLQYLCKRLPKPYDLFIRRFGTKKLKEKNNFFYEMRDKNYDEVIEVPSLSGCFMFFRSDVLKSIKGFDERFFMYMEDIDISRRASFVAKNIHYPKVKIFHEHAQGSYKSKKLLWIHVVSTLKYFFKWGFR